MKRLFLAALLCGACAFALGAQEAEDDFEIPLDEDFSEGDAGDASPAPAAVADDSGDESDMGGGDSGGGEKIKPDIAQGLWIETTVDTGMIIRDKKTGTDKGYEFDNAHFLGEVNWWFYGNITPKFQVDAEIRALKFDKTVYQEAPYANDPPTTTWADGFQSLLAMPFSVINEGADDNGSDKPGVFKKAQFGITTPYFNARFGYGDLKKNGMSEWRGIYTVLDRESDVGKGYTELRNGKDVRQFGDFTIDALVALSETRGTYGTYDILDVKYLDWLQGALTIGSTTDEDELFRYSQSYKNAASAYFMAEPELPVPFIFEVHGMYTWGTDMEWGGEMGAIAGRVTFNNDMSVAPVSVRLMQSFAGQSVDSVWGSDASSYDDDDIRQNNASTQLDVKWNALPFMTVGLDELLTFNDTSDMGDAKMTSRSEPMVDFDLGHFIEQDIKFGVYGVIDVDHTAANYLVDDEEVDRKVIPYVEEAGIECNIRNVFGLPLIKADYAISMDYKDWDGRDHYEWKCANHNIMISADITDRINVMAGSIIKARNYGDETEVPWGFNLGWSMKHIPIPGKPMVWAHFTYGMDPYEDNNYSMYRKDDPDLKRLHRTYLLNTYNYCEPTSHVRVGLIWDLS